MPPRITSKTLKIKQLSQNDSCFFLLYFCYYVHTVKPEVIYTQNRETSYPVDKHLQEWEQLAGKCDTASMHRLIKFYEKTLQFM